MAIKTKRKIRSLHLDAETEERLETLWIEAVNKRMGLSKTAIINKAIQTYTLSQDK